MSKHKIPKNLFPHPPSELSPAAGAAADIPPVEIDPLIQAVHELRYCIEVGFTLQASEIKQLSDALTDVLRDILLLWTDES